MPTAQAVRRPYLPDSVPESIRSRITPQLRRPLGLPAQVTQYIEIDVNRNELQRTAAFGSQDLRSAQIDSVDGMRMVGYPIEYAGKWYRKSTLVQAGLQECSTCGNIYHIEDMHTDGRCVTCAGIGIKHMGSKQTPEGGWTRHGPGDIFFGLELELEFPQATQTALLMAKTQTDLPFVYTEDGSLAHGIELNSYPMSLDYIDANNDKMIKLINDLKSKGASHKSYRNETSAAIHIHVTKEAFDLDNPYLRMWLNAHREWIKGFGERSEENFSHWSNIDDDVRENRRKYLNKRSDTIEARGFQSSILLSNPAKLPILCRWLLALGKASKTADEQEWVAKSPAQLMAWAGYSSDGFSEIAMLNAERVRAQKAIIDYRRDLAAFKRLILGNKIALLHPVDTRTLESMGVSTQTYDMLRNCLRAVCIGHTTDTASKVMFVRPDGELHTINVYHRIMVCEGQVCPTNPEQAIPF